MFYMGSEWNGNGLMEIQHEISQNRFDIHNKMRLIDCFEREWGNY